MPPKAPKPLRKKRTSSSTRKNTDAGSSVKKKSKTRTPRKNQNTESKKVTKKRNNEQIYFDNNGTTIMGTAALNAHIKWLKCCNPSSSSRESKKARLVIETATDFILNHCGVNRRTHNVIFTSGASESNCFILRSTARAYLKRLRVKNSSKLPHIIMSAIEHSASMICAREMIENKEAEITFVNPTIFGNIRPIDVQNAIRSNTCLISVMYANNEIPVINNIGKIGKIANLTNIPLHTDAVQIFGKFRIDMKKDNIEAMSASAHKFYGAKGSGVLIISKDLIEGYDLRSEICGTQQNRLRGGTENVASIASFHAALKDVFKSRVQKNIRMRNMRSKILNLLGNEFKFNAYNNYLSNNQPHSNLELVSLGPPENKENWILPNTILLAICKNTGIPFCNVDLKNFLEKKHITISIGSACHTSSKNASHVLNAIGASPIIKRGVIRISLGDKNTLSEVNRFVSYLSEGIRKQCQDININMEE